MKRSRFTESQIVNILNEQNAGFGVDDICRRHGIANSTFHKWKAKYGGLSVSDVQRMKALEDENARLKRLVADMLLENTAIKDVLSKKW